MPHQDPVPPAPATPALEPSDGAVVVRGRAAPYRIRRSTRAHQAALHIHPRRGLEVVLPARTPRRAAERLLTEKAAWLDRHADTLFRACQPAPVLAAGATLPYRGNWLALRFTPARRPAVRATATTLAVATPEPTDCVAVGAQLERWFRERARTDILVRLAALQRPSDGPVRRVVIRDQQTRWGSCSSRGTLSFNWRLVMAPPAVLDAVIVHELVHLRVPDHSPAFWRALDRRFPRHGACRRWLDANAYRLTL